MSLFVGTTEISSASVGNSEISSIWFGANQIWSNEPETADWLCFTAQQANSTVAMSVTGTPTQNQAFQYSTNGRTWGTFVPGTTTVLLSSVGDYVYFRGNNTTVCESKTVYYSFVMTGKIAASGNIMSLVDRTCVSVTIPSSYCFWKLFYECTVLKTAPTLPATTLAPYCYGWMFGYCDLTTAPTLPATTLADYCYYNIFLRNYNLVTPPTLPATTLAPYCYQYMFNNCSSLATTPSLSVTTLTEGCYEGMFAGTAITSLPSLPATTLAKSCYESMFDGCNNLTSLSSYTLPATTLAESCYAGMFAWCENLTSSPVLPATIMADSCYMGMFNDCEKLATAPTLPATTLADFCYAQMFYQCYALTKAPTLAATVMKPSCYAGMFMSCTSLITPPALPATTLAESCYEWMFYLCEGLYVYASSSSPATKAWVIPKNGSASTSYAMEYLFEGCIVSSGLDTSPTIGTQKTYYTQNTPV